MRKFIISLLIAGAAVSATPAAAQMYRVQPALAREIQQEINQLSRQITRAEQRRTISRREAVGLRRQAVTVQRNFSVYGRNGIDRRELSALTSQVNTVRARLRLERRDWDRRRG